MSSKHSAKRVIMVPKSTINGKELSYSLPSSASASPSATTTINMKNNPLTVSPSVQLQHTLTKLSKMGNIKIVTVKPKPSSDAKVVKVLESLQKLTQINVKKVVTSNTDKAFPFQPPPTEPAKATATQPSKRAPSEILPVTKMPTSSTQHNYVTISKKFYTDTDMNHMEYIDTVSEGKASISIELDLNAKQPITHKCTYCPRTFTIFDDLQFHIGLMHDDDCPLPDITDTHYVPLLKPLTIKCEMCGDAFDMQSELDDHEMQQHNSDNTDDNLLATTMECGFCGETFLYDRNLQSHIDSEHANGAFDVSDNDADAEQIEEIPSDNDQNSSIFDRIETCKLCWKDFQSMTLLRCHIINDHTDPIDESSQSDCDKPSCIICNPDLIEMTRLFRCHLCRQSCATNVELNEHYANEHRAVGEKAIENMCRVCFRLFDEVGKLFYHERDQHFDNCMFMCNMCPFANESLDEIADHVGDHKSWKCHQCQTITDTYDDWFVHVIRHSAGHYSKKKRVRIGRRSKRGADEHPKPCDICCANIVGYLNLRAHLDENHLNPATNCFCCPLCEFEAALPPDVRKHMATHKQVKSFSCDQCGREFLVKKSLISHLWRHQQVSKEYGCSVCGKMFKFKHQVKRHEKYHDDYRPFKCHLCDCAYKDLTDLRRHKRSHGIGEANIACKYCDKMFYEPKQLRYHMRSHAK